MSRANQAASRLTLGASYLDGYNGNVEIITRSRPRWWHRLGIGRRRQVVQRRFVDVQGSSARAWRR